jgi:indolepyruvate ferredoxin oxidoreductase alpha subunit
MPKVNILDLPVGSKQFLLGNHAIARGAIEAGVRVASAYPGTPSSEILEGIASAAKALGIHAEWSVNEKVALEVAIGASYSGVRSLVSMKHVGVNVALDPLVTLAYTGVKGGLVLVSADDPSLHSSQNEQDNRLLARFANIFCLEPYDPQSAKDYTKLAFDISEKFEIPVMVRTTTRVSHARGDVLIGEISKLDRRALFKKNPERFVCIPSHARPLHVTLNRKLKKMEEYSNKSYLNQMKLAGEVGIITSGVSRNYVKEALRELEVDASLLELGIVHPLPKNTIKKFLDHVERVLIVEELEPYLEDNIRALKCDVEIVGKGLVPREFELNVDIVRKAISEFMEIKHDTQLKKPSIEVPPRPPTLCPGCFYRALFYAVEKVPGAKIFPGDIGCYTLGVLEPLKTMDTCLCMGAGISQGAGMYHAGVREPIVALIGDSTFLHAGIPALMNAVYNKAKMTLIILDNRATAMTGFQPHPGIGMTATGEKTVEINFEEIARACGVKFVKTIKPLELGESVEAIREALSYDGVSVIIAQEPCALIAKKLKLWKNPPRVDEEKCIDYECQLWFPEKRTGAKMYERVCINLVACPAISWSGGKAKINEDLCNGCGFCVKICPKEAIIEAEDED